MSKKNSTDSSKSLLMYTACYSKTYNKIWTSKEHKTLLELMNKEWYDMRFATLDIADKIFTTLSPEFFVDDGVEK